MKTKLPHQLVQNMEATREILKRQVTIALDNMTRADAAKGGDDRFNMWNNAFVSLGALLDYHIEAEEVITKPVEVKWIEKIKRIPISLGKPEKEI